MFFGRWSMVEGWRQFVRSKFQRKNEFVSADARRLSNDPRTYELLSGNNPGLNIKSPDRVLTSPLARSPYTPGQLDSKQDYFSPARAYTNPVSSFSYPQTPSRNRDWDPMSTHAIPRNPDPKSYPMNKLP
jgi:hypothetical protein